MSCWKNDRVGGAGLRQVIFQPCTTTFVTMTSRMLGLVATWTPWPWPLLARPLLGDLATGEAPACSPDFWGVNVRSQVRAG